MAWAPSRAACNARAGDDAAEAVFFPVERLPSMAFDHLKVREPRSCEGTVGFNEKVSELVGMGNLCCCCCSCNSGLLLLLLLLVCGVVVIVGSGGGDRVDRGIGAVVSIASTPIPVKQ